eukprot:scaffold246146_cov42-Prasinocladus_malaysianus.AAC.1
MIEWVDGVLTRKGQSVRQELGANASEAAAAAEALRRERDGLAAEQRALLAQLDEARRDAEVRSAAEKALAERRAELEAGIERLKQEMEAKTEVKLLNCLSQTARRSKPACLTS